MDSRTAPEFGGLGLSRRYRVLTARRNHRAASSRLGHELRAARSRARSSPRGKRTPRGGQTSPLRRRVADNGKRTVHGRVKRVGSVIMARTTSRVNGRPALPGRVASVRLADRSSGDGASRPDLQRKRGEPSACRKCQVEPLLRERFEKGAHQSLRPSLYRPFILARKYLPLDSAFINF